jgi:hypothetical protein
MSTLDREPRKSGGPSTVFREPRIDPGVNTITPDRVNRPGLLSTPIPRGEDMTKAPKRSPVKR